MALAAAGIGAGHEVIMPAMSFSIVDFPLMSGSRWLSVGYVQDDIKWGPNLTINAGLRWDEEKVRDYTSTTVIFTKNEWQPSANLEKGLNAKGLIMDLPGIPDFLRSVPDCQGIT